MTTRREFIEKIALGGLGGIITSGMGPMYIENLRSNKGAIPLEEAQELHDECLIFDCHNDTAVERVAREENVATMLQLDDSFQSDVPKMNKGGYNGGAFIVGNGRIANVWVTLEQTLSMVESNPDQVMLVSSSDEFIRAQKNGKVGILPSIEGIAKWVMGKADILRMLYRNGVRWVSITHGEGGTKDIKKGPTYLQGTQSPYRYCTLQERRAELRNAGGLTPFGEEILGLSNELGIITDLAHINDRAYYDVLERAQKPVVVSHTAAFSLCNHSRNLTDDQIKALASNGGVMGCIFAPYLLEKVERGSEEEKEVSISSLVKHIAYVANLVGVEHAGIGSDYDGGVPVIVEPQQLVRVTQAMLEYGFTNNEIKKIWGGNILRVLKQNIG